MKILEKIIQKLATVFRINLLSAAYKGIGVSAEYEALSNDFYENILGKYFSKQQKLVCFDVGANLGDVTTSLLRHFPMATIHAFEPNPFTFKELVHNIASDLVVSNNFGLGQKKEDSKIFFYGDQKTTGHASMFREVFDLHKKENLEEHGIVISTLDEYCAENQIPKIDFLKIDTEGNEYFVLKGATSMLNNSCISVIQFEFNEMNIVSRVFLKDFYGLLNDFSFYRIKGDSLFPMGEYTSSNEIFRIQNILAVHNKFMK